MIRMAPADAGALHTSTFRGRNRNVQWLRAAAALFVVLLHASYYLAQEVGDERFLGVFSGEFGILGVAIFFAISGALMADILKTTTPGQFLVHRLIRIYPLATILAILLPFLVTGRLSVDLRALSLVPIGENGNYRLSVEWTLVFELFYYVVLFALALLGGARRVELFAALWLALVAVAVLFAGSLSQVVLTPNVLEMPFMAANAAFAGGLLIPWLVRRNAFQPALAVVAFTLAALSLSVDLAAGRLLGAVAAVIFVGLAVAEGNRDVPDNAATRLATRLGDWSYALYLSHVPVLLVVFRLVDASPPVLWALGIGAAILVSVPLGMLDLKLYRFLRRRSDRSTPDSFRRWALIYAATYAVVAVVFLFKD